MSREDGSTLDSKIQCDEHGDTEYCLLCQHLQTGKGLRYFAIKAEPDEPAQAWCQECDEVLEEERGWSDRADETADWKLCCTGCYEQLLEHHQLVSWVVGTSPEDFE